MKELGQLSGNVEALGCFFKLRRSPLVKDSKLLLASIEQTLKNLQEQNQVLEKLHAADAVNLDKLRQKLVNGQSKLATLKGEYAKLKEYLGLKTAAFHNQVSELKIEIASLRSEKNNVFSQLTAANDSINLYVTKEAELLNEIRTVEGELFQLKGHFGKQTEELDDLATKFKQQSERIELADMIELLLADNNDPFPAVESFSKLLEHDFIALANKENSLPEEALAYQELQAILQELKLAANLSGIKNKAMVVLSGGFSSGKSQFLNSLANDYKKGSKSQYLKVGTTPTTAVPTYVQSSDAEFSGSVTAYTTKGLAVTLTGEQFYKLTHNYINQLSFDIRSIMPFASVAFPMRIKHTEELSFVDTPGIDSSGSGITGNDKTTAEQFIKQANALLWFISIKSSGTIGEEDLRFLASVQLEQPELPIYIVANQADTNTEDQIEDKLYEFKEVLEDNHIEYAGLSAYSGFTGVEYEYLGQSLFEFLASCNQSHNLEEELTVRLDSIFKRYYQAFEAEIKRGKALRKAFDGLTLSILRKTGDMDLQEAMQPDIDNINAELQIADIEKLHNEFSELHIKMQKCIAQLFGKHSVIAT